MRLNYSGMAKIMALCLPFTFGLVACGDDSSSGANGDVISGDGDGDNDRTKAYCSLPDDGNEWVIDVIDGSDEYIQWREDLAVVVSKKKMGDASTCKSMLEQGGLSGTCDDEGYLTTTLNVEKYKDYDKQELREAITEHWYNCVTSSDSQGDSKSSSSKAEEYKNPFADIEEGCNFKIDDKVWKFYTKSELFGTEYKGYFYEYKEKGSVDSVHTYSYGSSIKSLCGLSGGDKDTSYTTENGVTVHSKSLCTDNGMEEFESQRGVDASYSRESAFNDFRSECMLYNNIEEGDADDEVSSSSKEEEKSSSSDEDEAESSSSKGDGSSSSIKSSSSIAESSSSEAPKSSSSYEIVFPTKYGKSCEFKKSDDTWYVQNENSYIVYEWTGNKAKETSVSFIDMDEPQLCLSMYSLMPDCSTEGADCTCDNELLIVKQNIQKEYGSKEDAFVEIMYNLCGIEVKIESSSSEAEEESSSSAAEPEEESSSSSAVNHCDFEKSDAEWKFVSESETVIYTWDSNDQYNYTAISVYDDSYESAEDCKAGIAVLNEEMSEDPDYEYEYTCDEAVAIQKYTTRNKEGSTDERNMLFEERCLYEE